MARIYYKVIVKLIKKIITSASENPLILSFVPVGGLPRFLGRSSSVPSSSALVPDSSWAFLLLRPRLSPSPSPSESASKYQMYNENT